MLLMTRNTRSGGVGQGRASFSAPRSGRSALTDDGAEGTSTAAQGRAAWSFAMPCAASALRFFTSAM